MWELSALSKFAPSLRACVFTNGTQVQMLALVGCRIASVLGTRILIVAIDFGVNTSELRITCHNVTWFCGRAGEWCILASGTIITLVDGTKVIIIAIGDCDIGTVIGLINVFIASVNVTTGTHIFANLCITGAWNFSVDANALEWVAGIVSGRITVVAIFRLVATSQNLVASIQHPTRSFSGCWTINWCMNTTKFDKTLVNSARVVIIARIRDLGTSTSSIITLSVFETRVRWITQNRRVNATQSWIAAVGCARVVIVTFRR